MTTARAARRKSMGRWDLAISRALLLAAIGGAIALQVKPAVSEPSIRGSKARVETSPAAPIDPRQSDRGYYVPYLTGPAGTRVPVMNIPGSVTVVPRSLMDDQQATTLGEALRNVPGVMVGR
jgi:outer membrane receptor for ferric coprogen and ferric-rhodotorulic acid